jgi:hypothetical protein
MAIFHLQCSTVSRSKCQSATAAASYRSASRIKDERTGQIHDYTRKRGVRFSALVFPAGVSPLDRATLWNQAEKAENRKNSTVAREFMVAIPYELNQHNQMVLAMNFATALTDFYGVAADLSIHEPGRGGDSKNTHAHVLITTRRITNEGLKEKTRELDQRKTGEVGQVRILWERLANEALDAADIGKRIDGRSREAQGLTGPKMRHLGPGATALERRGELTGLGNHNYKVAKFRAAAIQAEQEARARWATQMEQERIRVAALDAAATAQAQEHPQPVFRSRLKMSKLD